MKAKYIEPARCQSCVDLGWWTAEACAYCSRERTHTVEVLQLGTGVFGDHAIVKMEDGQLRTVRLSELTILEEENNEC